MRAKTTPTSPNKPGVELGRWGAKLRLGWYPTKTRDGGRMYLRDPDSTDHTSPVSFDRTLWDAWVSNMNGFGKRAFEAKAKSAGEPPAVTGHKTTLLEYLTTRADREVPLVKNQLGRMSFMQMGFYDLGVMTFLKLSKAPGLLPDDLWTFTLSDDPLQDELQLAREKFAHSFEKAIDDLVRGLDHVHEIARLDGELNMESARLLLERRKSAVLLIKADVYSERLALATACMPSPVLREYLERVTLRDLLNSVESARFAVGSQQLSQSRQAPVNRAPEIDLES